MIFYGFNTRLLLCMVIVLLINPIHAQRELWMSSTDSNIKKRATWQVVPKFQIPIGASHIDNMELIGPGKLLVGLRKDAQGVPNADFLLIDTQKGEVIWRFARDKGEYQIYLIMEDLLLVRVNSDKKTEFLAIDPANGSEKWKRSFKGKNISFLPVLPSGQIWAFNATTKKIRTTAFNIVDGQTVWESEKARTIENPASPVAHDEQVFTFFNGVEAFNPKNGNMLYQIPGVQLNETSPPPVFDEVSIHLVTADNKLVILDLASGALKSKISLPSDIYFTNLSKLNENHYLRGTDASAKHYLIALSAKDKKVIWSYQNNEPLLSNLILYEGKLFLGTPSSLLALSSTSGNQMLAVQVTDTGRNYPITVREIEENIVFIGELVVAAYSAKTGILKYKHGISPLGPDLHLNGLDASIPNLQKELSKYKPNFGPSLGSMANAETRAYQNMANKHYSNYMSYKNSGNYASSEYSYAQYKRNSKMAKTQATYAMAISLVDLGGSIIKGMQEAAIKGSIEEQELFRRSIIDVYSRSQTEKYLYRPHMTYHSSNDQYVTLRMIHLPTGKIRKTYLSPTYQSYGLWNLVDFENKMVYHHGVGMDPSLYKMSKPRKSSLFSKYKTVETFIIGMPITLVE